MTSQTPSLSHAWTLLTSRLNGDSERIVSAFHNGLRADMRYVSADALNDSLELLDAIDENNNASEWVGLFLDYHIHDSKMIEAVLDRKNAHPEILKQFEIVSRLDRLSGAELVAKVSDEPFHKQKQEVELYEEKQWIELLSEAEGELLAKSVRYIHSEQINEGLRAIEQLSTKSTLNKIALKRISLS